MDNDIKPIDLLVPLSIKCVDEVCDSLIELFKNILLNFEEFNIYLPLANNIISNIVDKLITPLKITTKDKIMYSIGTEKYVWTDSPFFRKTLSEVTSSKMEYDKENIILLLDSYFETVKYVVAHNIPKIIMNSIVYEVQKNLLLYLFKNVVAEDKIELLKENPQIEKDRAYYSDLKSRINNIKKSFSSM